MRKPLLLAAATAAATTAMLMATTTMAWAATPKPAVLTYTKPDGTNITSKTVLTSGLKPKTDLTLSFSAEGVTVTVKCTTATISSTVAGNPVSPGTAVTSPTRLIVPVSHCSAPSQTDDGATIKFAVTKVSFTLPSTETTFSDAAKFPVALIPGTKSAKYALELSLGVNVSANGSGVGSVNCGFASTKVAGNYSDSGPELVFTKARIGALIPSGSTTNCTTTILGATVPAVPAKLTGTFGPFSDTSVKGSPHLFVN